MPYKFQTLDERLPQGWPNHPELPEAVREKVSKQFHGTIAPPEPEGRAFLREFCRTVLGGHDVPPDALRLVAKRLERVLDGEPFAAAFELKARKGNKRTEQRQLRDKVIDAEVEALREFHGKGSQNDALDLVAKRYSLDPDTVRKIHLNEQRDKRNAQASLKRILLESAETK